MISSQILPFAKQDFSFYNFVQQNYKLFRFHFIILFGINMAVFQILDWKSSLEGKFGIKQISEDYLFIPNFHCKQIFLKLLSLQYRYDSLQGLACTFISISVYFVMKKLSILFFKDTSLSSTPCIFCSFPQCYFSPYTTRRSTPLLLQLSTPSLHDSCQFSDYDQVQLLALLLLGQQGLSSNQSSELNLPTAQRLLHSIQAWN